jgi:hypothetical protein
VRQLGIAPAAEARAAGVAPDQVEHHAQRRALARAVGPEEPGDPAGPDLEREVVDGLHLAVALAEPVDLDGCWHAAAG